jgi:hypothetical protein
MCLGVLTCFDLEENGCDPVGHALERQKTITEGIVDWKVWNEEK